MNYPKGSRIRHCEYEHWVGEVIFVDEDQMLHVAWDHSAPDSGTGYISPLRVKDEQPPTSSGGQTKESQ